MEAERRNLRLHDLSERSTAFFHDMSKMKSGPRESQLPDDAISINQVLDAAADYFSADFPTGIFAEPINLDSFAKESLFSSIRDQFSLSLASVEILERLFTYEELLAALKRTNGGKAPGPDGIPYEFYKAFPLLLHLLVKVALASHSGDGVPSSMLLGLISLVPKGDINTSLDFQTYFKQFRPITLLDCDSKIILLAFAMRLSTALPDIIGPEQSAFLPNRSIMDIIITVLDAQSYAEMVDSVGVLLGLDWAGAYDVLARAFLYDTCEFAGFGPRALALIKAFHTGTEASVILNGYVSRLFPIKRGVRQGDPSACCLFILAFHVLLLYQKSAPGVVPFKGPNGSSFSALGFADDANFLHGVSSPSRIPLLQPSFRACDVWARASGSRLNLSKTFVCIFAKSLQERDIIRDALLQECNQLLPSNFIVEGASSRILGAFITQGPNLSDVAQLPQSSFIAIKKKVIDAIKAWRRVRLTLSGKVYVANSELFSRFWYFFILQQPSQPLWTSLLDEIYSFILHKSRRASSTPSWNLSRWRYEAHTSNGGLGLLPAVEHLHALRCRFVARFLQDSTALWWPFANFWFSSCSYMWNLGLGFLDPSASRLSLSSLPPHWKLCVQAFRKVKPSYHPHAFSLLRSGAMTFMVASNFHVFYNSLVLDTSNLPLVGASWRPIASAGITRVGDVVRVLTTGLHPRTSRRLSPNFRAKLTYLLQCIPVSWLSEGPSLHMQPVSPTSFLGWSPPSEPWVFASESTVRLFRSRIWDLQYANRSDLLSYVPPECWRGHNAVFLSASFNWKIAFSRLWLKGRPSIQRTHTESIFKILHGLYMSPRPFGSWGFPRCPWCGVLADTSHALSCSLHISAITWFWETASSLIAAPVSRTWGALLGGVSPSSFLKGFTGLAYVWDVLRCAFLSSLYRLWLRASYTSRSLSLPPGMRIYEGRHVILATISAVRRTIVLDARRVVDGVSHTQRNGSRRVESRRASAFRASWLASGWVSSFPSDSDFSVLFSPSFPVPVPLVGLSPPNFSDSVDPS